MEQIMGYINEYTIPAFLLLIALVMSAVCFQLYIKEKRKGVRIRSAVDGERNFYRMFAENRKEIYAVVRRGDLRILYVSPNFEKLTGIPQDMLYADIEAVKSIVSQKTARSLVQKMKEWTGEEDLYLEFDYKRPGVEENGHGRITIQVNEENDCYLISFSDITADYRKLQDINAELAKAYKESQAKTDFLSKMSHEIRTPMNGILGMLSLAKTYVNTPEQTEQYLTKAESLSQFLLTLINDILDMSRIESGRMELEKAEFDLFGVADKLDSMFRNTAQSKGIHWEVKMQEFDVRYVIGDELRLTQVIVNFISNANKFTPAGGTVSVTFRQMNKINGNLHLMIRVRDTGKGIKKDFISRIFRPFEQEDASTARNYGGSGLGMAIADNIIKMMNGEIIVESEEGKGTEFVVYLNLPIADREQEAPGRTEDIRAVEDEAYKKAVEEFSLEGLHILLAEDNDINAEIAIAILEMEGAKIVRACNGKEAVELFEESAPGTYDVILMDIQMPIMTGWEATEKIRMSDKEDADILILAMSANAFIEDKRHSMEIGMNGHISKPVDYDEVRRIIAENMYLRSKGVGS